MKALLVLFVYLAITSPSLAELPSYTDAEYLALEYSGELLPPPALVAEYHADLTTIRSAWSEVADVHPIEEFTPGYLLVALTDEAYASWLAGTFTELEDLNTLYGANHADPLFNLKYLRIHFTPLNHPLVMGPVYEALEGVRFTSGSATAGDGDDITVDGPRRYTLSRGWGDCLSGCLNHEYWVFEVAGGVPWLRDHYYNGPASVPGPALPGPDLEAAPNPFNPATVISYKLDRDCPVKLTIYDVRGRPVATLVDRNHAAGEYTIPWAGTNDAGSVVASGVYFCRLETEGDSKVKAVTLLK